MTWRLPSVDFVAASTVPDKPAGWALLFIGALACAAAAYLQVLQTREQEQRAAWVAKQTVVLEEAKRRSIAARQESSIEALQRALEPRLQEPWLPVLRRVELVTRSPIYLSKLSIDGAKGEVRLEAEAPSLDAALEYVGTLADTSALRDASLVRHEQLASAAADSRIRFAATARWSRP